MRTHGRTHPGKKAPRESGFTMIELAITLIILGIITSMTVLAYSAASRSFNLSGARKQVEAAIERAKTAARQENVSYQLVVYNSSETHANCYEFLRNQYQETAPGSGTMEWKLTPVDKSVVGEATESDGGHYYIKVSNGVKVTQGAVINFTPEGTTMTVTAATIGLSIGGSTGSVSVDSNGRTNIN